MWASSPVVVAATGAKWPRPSGMAGLWWNRVGLRVRRVVRGRGEELIVEGEAGLGHWLCLRRVEYRLWSASVALAGAGLIAVAALALADGDELS